MSQWLHLSRRQAAFLNHYDTALVTRAVIGAVDALTLVYRLSVELGVNHGLLQGSCLLVGQADHAAVRLLGSDFRQELVVADDEGVDARFAVSRRVLRAPLVRRLRAQVVVVDRGLRVEELVLEDLGRLGALLGVVAEAPFHQPDGLRRGARDHLRQVYLLVLRQGEHLPVGQAPRVRPVVIAGLAEDH